MNGVTSGGCQLLQRVGHNRRVNWQTGHVGTEFVLAPDGSQIRPLVAVPERGSLVHCTLPAGQVTQAVQHRTVAEVWYCVAGSGQVWRQVGQASETVALEPGVAISIPLGTGFQFRASDTEALEVVITTMPPWPGDGEAFPIAGVWEATP